jgi:MFS transporter, putative metabolite:H+ symporter
VTLAAATPSTKLTSSQRRLFLFLGVATFFEGFDYIALARILPTLRQEFALTEAGIGTLMAVVGCGAILAYGLIRYADVAGRRRVLAITIAGYTACSLLTAFAQDVYQFGAAQMFARMFLLAEYAVSMVYVAEEFPADRRGFAVGVLQGASSLGSVICAGIAPWLIDSPWGFRTLYVVGAVPLLLMMFLRRNVAETARFQALGTRPRFVDFFRIFSTPHWRRIPLLATVWSLTYLCTYSMVTFWTDFAVNERGFDQKSVSLSLMFAAVASLPFVFLSGRFLDKVGRRRGATVIFSVASFAVLLAYLAHGFWPLTCGLALGIFAASAVLPVLSSLTLELFPTAIRADAYGWVNNVFARVVGYVAGPFVIGLVAEQHGYGPTVAATFVFPLLALALILARLPETSGKELEETSALH